jgi:hypothetical protein
MCSEVCRVDLLVYLVSIDQTLTVHQVEIDESPLTERALRIRL